LIKTSPPTRRFACRRTGPRPCRCGLCRCRCGLGAIAFVKLPLSTVAALRGSLALWNLIVLENDILNDRPDLVSSNAHTPALVRYNIIDTLDASMASRLHGVASKRARSSSSVASPDIDGVGGVAKVVYSCIAPSLRQVRVRARRHRKSQSGSWQCFRNRLESDHGYAVSQA
jgi:hypothetical protein